MASYYDILEIDPSANDREIRRSYRRLMRDCHPDLRPDLQGAALDEVGLRVALLSEAKDTLSHPRRRAAYDREIGVHGERVKAAARWIPPLVPEGFLPYPGRDWGKVDYVTSRARDAEIRALSLSAYTSDFSELALFAPDRLWGLAANSLPVTDDQLRHLSKITTLTMIELNDTDITDEGIMHLIPLTNLNDLLLWGTRITDASLRLIGRFEKLKNLNLGDTSVSDEGLAHLSRLLSLDTLNLRGTRVRGPGLRHLHGLKELDWLALSRGVERDPKRAIEAALPALEVC